MVAASALNLNINEGGFSFGDGVDCKSLIISTKQRCVMVGLVLISVTNREQPKRKNCGRGVYIVSSETRVDNIRTASTRTRY
jgi:hypothetical protein